MAHSPFCIRNNTLHCIHPSYLKNTIQDIDHKCTEGCIGLLKNLHSNDFLNNELRYKKITKRQF